MRVVDVLATIRSSRFDVPLSYDAGDLALRVGDVVRVPLGNRDVFGFVVADVREEPVTDRALKPVRERCDVPRAFDESGLALARFVADAYLCTLGEALGAVVLADAVPRVVERFEPVADAGTLPDTAVPARFQTFVREVFSDGFALEALLRHPEARRIGDRRTLLRYVATLQRKNVLRRVRRFPGPKTHEYRVAVLDLGDASVRGPKANALVDFVRAQRGVPRADAVLAGFSRAIIARALAAGALVERAVDARARRVSRSATLPPHVPTGEQSAAIDRVCALLAAQSFGEVLLFGATGSGKTLVYLHAIAGVVQAGGRAIVLVPEISLTPQTARRFEDAFGERVAVLHSALSDRERFDAWQACARGEIDVVVGARSAVFAPLPDVKLIVVDEAHETSYKQDNVPRYSAVAVARERMRRSGGVLVLGSATPSLESYALAKAGRIEMLTLRERATGQPFPSVRIVDMKAELEAGNKRIFSTSLTQGMHDCLARGEKSVLFVNRRGSARFVLCRTCGHVPECPRCSVTLAVHRGEKLLRCHYCDWQAALTGHCPACGADAYREFGVGTERVVEEIARLFPHARVVRLDSDAATRIGDHARLLAQFERDGDILVGTQMVAKGLDYPTVTLVGVVAADIGLHVADFRAAERTFALIAQVCGRSGRARPGEAIVQTYSPTHPAVLFAAQHDYEGFAREELADRKALGFPPYRRLVYVGVAARDRTRALAVAQSYADVLTGAFDGDVLGPAPHPIARLNDEWRFRMALRTRTIDAARTAIREKILPLAHADRTTRIAINVDP